MVRLDIAWRIAISIHSLDAITWVMVTIWWLELDDGWGETELSLLFLLLVANHSRAPEQHCSYSANEHGSG